MTQRPLLVTRILLFFIGHNPLFFPQSPSSLKFQIHTLSPITFSFCSKFHFLLTAHNTLLEPSHILLLVAHNLLLLVTIVFSKSDLTGIGYFFLKNSPILMYNTTLLVVIYYTTLQVLPLWKLLSPQHSTERRLHI